jgi:hypothetical protein
VPIEYEGIPVVVRVLTAAQYIRVNTLAAAAPGGRQSRLLMAAKIAAWGDTRYDVPWDRPDEILKVLDTLADELASAPLGPLAATVNDVYGGVDRDVTAVCFRCKNEFSTEVPFTGLVLPFAPDQAHKRRTRAARR